MKNKTIIIISISSIAAIGVIAYFLFKKPKTSDTTSASDLSKPPVVTTDGNNINISPGSHVPGSVRRAGLTDEQWKNEQIVAAKFGTSGRG